MIGNYSYGFLATMVLAILAGFPVAVWCGIGRGVRAIGYASAIGTALLLIFCRGVQMLWPLSEASWPMLVLVAGGILVAWTRQSTRKAVADLLQGHGRGLAIIMLVIVAMGVLLGVPILFGDVIQYDGTRNADSFTFTQSAQYMLGHAFHGAPDFTPEQPVYAISRGYFGDGAMQPRPAAEGLLAWLSALRGVDPMYLYNAVQAAGVMLAGLSALAFLPLGWQASSARDWVLLAIYVAACPSLVHVATNSNFANAFSLPAATTYVAFGLLPRTRGTFVAGTLSIGCLLSGYPELLVFVAMTRALGVAMEGVTSSTRGALGGVVREGLWMMAELIAACALLPWAALATFAVYKTTLGVSQTGASELTGNMFAGVPLFAGATIALMVAWRALGAVVERGRRWYLLSILLAFSLAQGLMLARGFDYGGFKVSEYFVTLLIGVALRSVLARPAGIELGRTAQAVAIALAAVMVVKCADVVRRAWDGSHSRQVTPDLVRAGHELGALAHGRPVVLGTSPQPFYYGMWVPYVVNVPIAYDLARDPNAAGYLSPYLRMSGRARAMLDAAKLQLDIDVQDKDQDDASVVARFGSVVIRKKEPQPGGG